MPYINPPSDTGAMRFPGPPDRFRQQPPPMGAPGQSASGQMPFPPLRLRREPVAQTSSPNAIRPIGPTGGYDPSYLQNLATSEGGLFQRGAGGLAFNPLGNLADIQGTQFTGGGNAPLAGLPQTMLSNALAQNPFFLPQANNSLGLGGVGAVPNLAKMFAQQFGGPMFGGLGNANAY